jgi:hypothetical protein
MPGTIQFEDPVRHLTRKYELDYLPSKNYVWKEQIDRNRSFSSESLAEDFKVAPRQRGRPRMVALSKRATFHIAAYALSGRCGQQVSRWRNSLKDETKYHDVLYGPSYKKAT